MRKYLEQEMLADALRGRIRYGCTTFVGMDGCHVFWVCVDGVQVKRFSWETVNTYFIEKGLKKNCAPHGIAEYWSEFWPLLEKYDINERTEYTDGEFCDALAEYRNQDIQKSIGSEDPIVRMFAVLDRRVGKRTLKVLKDSLNTQPEWLRYFYQSRLDAESI